MDAVDFWWTPIYPFNAKYFRILLSTSHNQANKNIFNTLVLEFFNTFNALKESGINEVIDGYGLMPYEENEIKFIPQLFYKVYALPFGIQSTQIHLNNWNDNYFDKFEIYLSKTTLKSFTKSVINHKF